MVQDRFSSAKSLYKDCKTLNTLENMLQSKPLEMYDK